MPLIKALHIIFVITWFAALFYLPRLFVYHAMSQDTISLERFKVMERKLYYGIMMPSGLLATIFGLWLLVYNKQVYAHNGWMSVKLLLVAALWMYHWLCNRYRKQFLQNANRHSHVFYRWFNEIPAIILVAIVLLVFLKL